MRLKKVKNADILIKKSEYLIENPSEYKGKWNTLFKNNNKLEIEIGMGKGDFVISKALNNPDINYIGIEKFDSVLLRACEKLEDLEISNLRLILMDARNLDTIFDREIDLIYLNFSDPWPKKRHTKRRLTSSTFLNVYETISKENINIKQKTDNYGLFQYSKESYLENGFKILEENDNYGLNEKNIEKTEYEKKFISLLKPIYYVSVTKNNKNL